MLLNCNWAIVSDITLYIVIPTRRSFASATQILVSHAFGDAISPYLIGAIADWVKAYISNDIPPDTIANYASTANASLSTHTELSLDTSSIEVNKYWLPRILYFWFYQNLILDSYHSKTNYWLLSLYSETFTCLVRRRV